MPRLIVELTSNQHYEIKNRAALEGKSIKNFVIENLFNKQQKIKIPEKLIKDSKFFETLKELFAGKGNVSEMDLFSFFENSNKNQAEKIGENNKQGEVKNIKHKMLSKKEKPKPIKSNKKVVLKNKHEKIKRIVKK